MMDWLLFSCIACFIAACILGCLLYANWRIDQQIRRIDDETNKQIARQITDGDCTPCPWNIEAPDSHFSRHADAARDFFKHNSAPDLVAGSRKGVV